MAVLSEPENHRGTHIKGVSIPPETPARPTRNHVALEHQRLRPFGSQLRGSHQTTNPRADHDHIPVRLGARGHVLGSRQRPNLGGAAC